MKILVSTMTTQGQRTSDFSFCHEGEPVRFGMACDKDRRQIDGSCGCRRSMCGFETQTATTTMQVVERDWTSDEFRQRYLASLKSAVWLGVASPDHFMDEINELLRIAKAFPVGTIVEKRGNKFGIRD